MSEQRQETRRRAYRKRRRAEQEEETRRRITEAAVELHGSVGPARTTVSGVAELAGVQRATVYRHFPDEEALYGACSAHWLAQNPLPDMTRWEAIADPQERLLAALADLYAWYEGTDYMLERTTRDAPLVPAMQAPMAAMAQWREMVVEVLVRGRPARGERRRRVRAAIALALDFATWRTLAAGRGLDRAAAVELMGGLAAAAEAR
jgi:AcrR family transcriptional regulator